MLEEEKNQLQLMIHRHSIATEIRWFAVHESTPRNLKFRIMSIAVAYLDAPDDVVISDSSLSVKSIINRIMGEEDARSEFY